MSRPGVPAAVALAVAGLLGACAVGPRFVEPATPPAAARPFVSAADPAVASPAPPPPKWWRLYRDPVLDGLVQEALVHNADLEVAAANLAYAQGLLEEARAGRFPTTAATASGPGYGRSSIQIFDAAAPYTGYAAGFTAAYDVDLFGRVRRAIEAARANAQAVQAAEDVTRVTVAGETAGAYANICGYGEQLDIARRSLGLVQETYDLTAAQRDAGALSDFDVARAGALLAQARAAIAPLDGQRRAALFTLAALIGKTPAEIPVQAAACHAPPRLTQPLPVGDGAAMLRRRPDLREAERQLAAATARIGVATADLYPTLTLGGSIDNIASTLKGLGSSYGLTYSVSPGVSWSFPNILTARAHIREAGAQAAGALAAFDAAVLQSLKESETVLSAYGAELDQHAALVEARAAADQAQRLADFQFKAGAASVLDLILAQQSAVSADQAVAQSDQTLSTDQVAVFQALGGGWEDAAPVIPLKPPGR